MNIKYMDIEAWMLIQKDLPIDQIKVVDCEFCNGSGKEACESCGHITTCDECEGTGKVIDYGEIQTMYEHQVNQDREAFEAYMRAVGVKQ